MGPYFSTAILYMFKVIPEIFTMAFFLIFDIFDFEVEGSQILLKMPDLHEKTSKRARFPHFLTVFTKMMKNWFNYNLNRPLAPINAPFLVKN